MRKIDTLIIHCSATKPGMDIGRDEINDWHSRSFEDGQGGHIAYHKVIRRDGTIEDGRPFGRVGAHTSGHNTTSIGICLVGGVDNNGKPENNYTAEQMTTLHRLVGELQKRFRVEDKNIRGHRDFPGVAKACPSFDVQSWWTGDESYVPARFTKPFWAGIDYFRPDEFKGFDMDIDFIRKLDDARSAAGMPFVVKDVHGPKYVTVRIKG